MLYANDKDGLTAWPMIRRGWSSVNRRKIRALPSLRVAATKPCGGTTRGGLTVDSEGQAIATTSASMSYSARRSSRTIRDLGRRAFQAAQAS